jgi:hypothetical protein
MASLIASALSELVARKQHLPLEDCTVDTCAITSSYYYYRVSLPANAVFLALFSISLIGFVGTYALTRRGFAFTFAMISGVTLEIVGYVGRIQSWQNQWQQEGFLMQIVCLTIAPAFMAGGIYLCLRRIVYAFGPENSRIAPESYTRIVSHYPTVFALSKHRANFYCTVYPMRSCLSLPSSSRWWIGFSSLPPEQISQARR